MWSAVGRSRPWWDAGRPPHLRPTISVLPFPQRRVKVVLLSVIFIATTIMCQPMVCATKQVTFTISIPGESQRVEGTTPVMVSGFWHDLKIETGGAYNNITVLLYSGTVYPVNGSETNLYLFTFENGSFKDARYNSWIAVSNSTSVGGVFNFRVCVNSRATVGAWTIQVNASSAEILKGSIIIRAADARFGLSAPNFQFWVEPKTAGRYLPTGADYFRTNNDGNIPMGLRLEFNRLGDWLHATNLTMLKAGKELKHYLTMDAPSWEPGQSKAVGSIVASPLYRGPKDVLGIDLAYSLEFSVEVVVGRGGLALEDTGMFVLQYPANLSCEYKKELQYNIYLTGIREVELSIRLEGATLKAVRMGGSQVTLPLVLNLTKTGEVSLNVTVKPTIKGGLAKVYYHIKTTDGLVDKEFATDVPVPQYVEPLPDPEAKTLRDRTFAIIFLVVMVVVGISCAYYIYEKSRRREAMKERQRKKGGRRT